MILRVLSKRNDSIILKPQCREPSYLISSQLFLSQLTAENEQLQGGKKKKSPFWLKNDGGVRERRAHLRSPRTWSRGAAAVLQVLLNHCDRIAAISWIIKPRSAGSGDGEGELENPALWITSGRGFVVIDWCRGERKNRNVYSMLRKGL